MGTALTFHYLNRMVSAFLKPSPVTLPARVNDRAFMTRMLAVFPGRMLGVTNLEPGASLRFCPPPRSRPELVKLGPAPEVAAGLNALVDSAEAAGAAVLSSSCRAAVASAVDSWDGSDPGLGSVWIDEGVGGLSTEERPAARFALVCALASYRVDGALVEPLRRTHPTDAELVSIAGWASARATLRIASWI